MLKKDAYHWNEVVITTFNHLKRAMSQPLVLALPNLNKLFVVEINAFGARIEAILM